jgi:multidrug transporter EmrE-like cation transporter
VTYLWLLLAILFEITWAVAMKLSHGLTRPVPASVTVLAYLFSVVFLALAARRMELGVAYATWAGLGVAGIAAIGVIHFREPATALKLVSLAMVIAGIVGLNAGSRQ